MIKGKPRWWCCGVAHRMGEKHCSQCGGKRRVPISRKKARESFERQAPDGAKLWWLDKD